MSHHNRLSDFFREWVYRVRRSDRPARGRPRLNLETIEDRIAPTVVAAPSVIDTRTVIGDVSFSPSSAIDPLNPDRMVVASVQTNTGNTASVLNVHFSTNAGQTWTRIVNQTVVPTPFSTGIFPDPIVMFDPEDIAGGWKIDRPGVIAHPGLAVHPGAGGAGAVILIQCGLADADTALEIAGVIWIRPSIGCVVKIGGPADGL